MKSRNQPDWAEVRKRCRLSAEALEMAKTLGMSPRDLIKNIPSRSEPWKAPVEDWVRHLYGKRFKGRPASRDLPSPGAAAAGPPASRNPADEDVPF